MLTISLAMSNTNIMRINTRIQRLEKNRHNDDQSHVSLVCILLPRRFDGLRKCVKSQKGGGGMMRGYDYDG